MFEQEQETQGGLLVGDIVAFVVASLNSRELFLSLLNREGTSGKWLKHLMEIGGECQLFYDFNMLVSSSYTELSYLQPQEPAALNIIVITIGQQIMKRNELILIFEGTAWHGNKLS